MSSIIKCGKCPTSCKSPIIMCSDHETQHVLVQCIQHRDEAVDRHKGSHSQQQQLILTTTELHRPSKQFQSGRFRADTCLTDSRILLQPQPRWFCWASRPQSVYHTLWGQSPARYPPPPTHTSYYQIMVASSPASKYNPKEHFINTIIETELWQDVKII